MSTANQTDAANSIYQQALKGSPKNAGLPDALAKLLVGQSGNETGGWTSDFFVNGNACFGYSCSSSSSYQTGCSSATSDNGVTVGYYDSIEDSTNEIIDWIYRRVADGKFPKDLTTITDADQYATLLSNAGYFTSGETAYASNIDMWINKLADFFSTALSNPPASIIMALVLIGLIIFAFKKKLFEK